MKTRTIILLTLWFVLLVIAMVGLFYLTFCTEAAYYAQVDNAYVKDIIPRGGMYYRYELPSVDDRGKERLLTFETTRLLREGAWLKITVAPIRGVTAWEEVQIDALPAILLVGN